VHTPVIRKRKKKHPRGLQKNSLATVPTPDKLTNLPSMADKSVVKETLREGHKGAGPTLLKEKDLWLAAGKNPLGERQKTDPKPTNNRETPHVIGRRGAREKKNLAEKNLDAEGKNRASGNGNN